MFNFLNPTILFAAAAAVIPLIIHLFSRRKVKVVEFSSLRHLKAMQRQQVRRLKIRQLLLLIIRTLLILAVVLAFARPTTRGGSAGAHATVSAVVLFDNSASMNRYVADGKLCDLAKKRTEELLATFTSGDQVALIPLASTDDELSTAGFGSAAVAGERLKRLGPGHRKGSLQAGLESAVKLIAGAANLNREIYLVTDRQRQSEPDKQALADCKATVYLVDLPTGDIDNDGITALDFGGQLIMPDHEFAVTATVRNYSDQIRTDQIASLFLDGRRVAQTGFSVNAGSEAVVRFAATVAQTGLHSGYVEIPDDILPEDNRYYFSFGIPERFNVLLVDNDPSAAFVNLALTPSPDQNLFWSVKSVSPDQIGETNIDQYDVIVLAGMPLLSQDAVSQIRAHVKRGKGLWLLYGPKADPGYFNRTWGDISGTLIDAPAPPVITRAGFYTIKSVEMSHPIFSIFGLSEEKFPEIRFFSLPTVHTSPSARVLMRFSGDRPALVETPLGQGKVLTLCGPIGPDFSDLVSHAFLVPMVSRIAEYLSSNLSIFDVRLFTDAIITRTLNVGAAITSPVELVTPDSSVFSVLPEDAQGSAVVRAHPTGAPGIYSLRYLGREIDRFAINVDPAECDLTIADKDQYAASLGAARANTIPVGHGVAASVAGFRVGRELWPIFGWLAVILISAEMLLGRGAPSEERE
ncbi:MAG: BatA domain-containing protein [candidate division Zixibacteria bacterium]|nr:BatA domain-containing protein [candidate division Zixibacteria bacterium]